MPRLPELPMAASADEGLLLCGQERSLPGRSCGGVVFFRNGHRWKCPFGGLFLNERTKVPYSQTWRSYGRSGGEQSARVCGLVPLHLLARALHVCFSGAISFTIRSLTKIQMPILPTLKRCVLFLHVQSTADDRCFLGGFRVLLPEQRCLGNWCKSPYDPILQG